MSPTIPSEMRPLIDYTLLAQAISYYRANGYQQVEVPWLVSRQSCFATLPAENSHFAMPVRDHFLVGSAEQGFLETDLPPGRYLAVSPCFRNDAEDRLHQQTFIKVELHQTDDTSDQALAQMIDCALAFYAHSAFSPPTMVETPEGFDIEIEGVEVGSYGRRQVNERLWLYGTGLALPRFSVANGC